MYRVLYRKWRPQVFDDVVGQPQVTVTLASQVRENRLSHAYLFTGARGTGKTTCAKILSKAVNCLHPVNGNPCNECEICRGIDSGTVLDIVEIDAASNRGIDDIRLLRDEANFTPARAKYRVYIIDEVHMLTIEAFNALLKTLEEPPEHVKFILATTEVYKLPSTILSRCQRFDFRRIEPKVIAERLMQVASAEGAVLQPDAAMLIARIADGGMRDALSLLDRAMSVENTVTADVVSVSAGLMGREQIYSLCRTIAQRDVAGALTLLDELHNASCDTQRLITELTDQFRNFLIIQTVKAPENLIVCTASEMAELKTIAAGFTKEEILFALRVLTDTADAVKRTQNRRVEAEMAVIRLCHPAAENDASALAARVSVLEKELAALKTQGIRAEIPSAASVLQTPAPEPAAAAQEPPTEKIAMPADTPNFEEDVPWEEEPPKYSLPFDEPQPPTEQPDFAGFAAEHSGGYANRFSETQEDDAPFDFDAFMAEHSGGRSEKPAEPAEAPASAAPEPPASAEENIVTPREGELDARTWLRIILDTERSFTPLVGLLTDSKAVIRGEALIIYPASNKLRFMLQEDILARYLGPVAQRILGKM